MADAFTFSVHAVDGAARVGAIATPRGPIRTPAFMPVGTAATVKAMYPGEVCALGADVVLANTYLLDKTKVEKYKFPIQVINTTLPLLMIILLGIILNIYRKRKFTKDFSLKR